MNLLFPLASCNWTCLNKFNWITNVSQTLTSGRKSMHRNQTHTIGCCLWFRTDSETQQQMHQLTFHSSCDAYESSRYHLHPLLSSHFLGSPLWEQSVCPCTAHPRHKCSLQNVPGQTQHANTHKTVDAFSFACNSKKKPHNPCTLASAYVVACLCVFELLSKREEHRPLTCRLAFVLRLTAA